MTNVPNRLRGQGKHAGNPRCANAIGQLLQRQDAHDHSNLLHTAAQQFRQLYPVPALNFDTQRWASHAPSMC
jgi:hypothetical protein